MGKQKLLPQFQVKGTSLESPSLITTTPLRNMNKRHTRKIWILSFLIISTFLVVWFPPSITLFTWSSEYGSTVDPSTLVVYPKDGSNRLWPIELKDTSNSEKNVDSTDKSSQGSQNLENLEMKETPNLFERIVVKEAPSGRYKPLRNIRLDPKKKYENVKAGTKHLTKELEQTKFLTYLPHSGFHNQRIEIKNAFKLAKLLNRTLILPALRLGHPVAWQPSQELVQLLENDELKYDRFAACLDSTSQTTATQKEECDYYSSWTSVPVGYILNIEPLTEQVPVIDRPDLRESWLWHTLKLSPGEWLEVKDDSRYSYQIYESSSTRLASGSSSKYNWRLNVDELAHFNEARLLSFGSLFGSTRVVLSSDEMKNWDKKIEKFQALNLPLLEKISDKAAERLGGRRNYLGLHLRVGNAFFKTQAAEVMRATFIDICKNILQLDQEKIDDLIRKHEQMMETKADTSTNLKGQLESRGDARIKSSKNMHFDVEQGPPKDQTKLQCRGNLHNDQGDLKEFNLPIYLSTDVTFDSLQKDPAFSIFTYYFPCLFSLDDLNIRDDTIQQDKFLNRWKTRPYSILNIQKIDALKYDDQDELNFHQMKSNLDGLNLDRFLIPMLESMIVSKGSHVIGTTGSTFSSYLINFLHPAYLAEEKNHRLD